jgi:predicted AlkP superfamily pyrophosphatase or phosphodiesterase
MMEKYKSSERSSGVSLFEIGTDYIQIQFSTSSRRYCYSYQKAGEHHVEQMKILAKKGSGLNTYINRYVKKLYD